MQKDMPEDIRERKENFPMKKVGVHLVGIYSIKQDDSEIEQRVKFNAILMIISANA